MGRLPVRSGNGCLILLFRARHQSSLSSPLICSGLRTNFLRRLCIIRTVLKIVRRAIIVMAVNIVIDNSPIFGPPDLSAGFKLMGFCAKILDAPPRIFNNLTLPADVAELADAQASGACGLRPVEVRLLSSAVNSHSGITWHLLIQYICAGLNHLFRYHAKTQTSKNRTI
jgi:hypothetical protein